MINEHTLMQVIAGSIEKLIRSVMPTHLTYSATLCIISCAIYIATHPRSTHTSTKREKHRKKVGMALLRDILSIRDGYGAMNILLSGRIAISNQSILQTCQKLCKRETYITAEPEKSWYNLAVK